MNFSPDMFWIFSYPVIAFLARTILNLILASAVFADAGLLRSRLRRGTFLVGPGVWWVITAFGGIFAVGIYWLIHHSRLRPTRPLVEGERDDSEGQSA